ncbi:MAG: hypothetical protein NT001_01910 [Candidatus Woesearchaeota archaeon]|nr:hypothetical protein [Candidatus Woesearchaeota archaeon]
MSLEIITAEEALKRERIGESEFDKVREKSLIEFESAEKAREWALKFMTEYIQKNGEANHFPIGMIIPPSRKDYELVKELTGQDYQRVFLTIPNPKVEEVKAYISQNMATPDRE